MERLETDRLILREWTLADAEDMFDYAKSPVVGPNAGWKPHKSVDESKSIIRIFIESGDVLAIVVKGSDKVIGSIGIHERTPDLSIKHLKQREIGYILHPDYWGNGYIPEAVGAIIAYGFDRLSLDLIWCAHYDFNMRSKRVIEKTGFRFNFSREEVLERMDDLRVTTMYYGMSREDWSR